MKKLVKDERGNIVEVDLTYMNMQIEDIIKWCQENGADKIAWLKQTASTPVVVKDKNKQPVLDEEGNVKTRQITFIDLKLAFVDTFMKELAPKRKPKKENMFDLIAKL